MAWQVGEENLMSFLGQKMNGFRKREPRRKKELGRKDKKEKGKNLGALDNRVSALSFQETSASPLSGSYSALYILTSMVQRPFFFKGD